MNNTRAPEIAVAVAAPITTLMYGLNEGIISLALGLLGVLLARSVFVSRENRALGRRQSVRETLPVTGLACLIAGGVIWDGHLIYSKAIFTGIAVGWSTIVTIEAISRVINPAARAKLEDMKLGDGTGLGDLTALRKPDQAMSKSIDQLDRD